MKSLTADGRLLFATRLARLFAYGFLAVVLVLYLAQAGLSEASIGLLLTLTLIGDTVISLWLTTRADRFGRRRTLIVGTLLMIFAAILFANTQEFIPLLIAATIGVISPSGNEVGPFLSIEQAALSQIVPDRERTHVFAWYNLVGSFATAFGALCGGGLAQAAAKQRRDAVEQLSRHRDRLRADGAAAAVDLHALVGEGGSTLTLDPSSNLTGEGQGRRARPASIATRGVQTLRAVFAGCVCGRLCRVEFCGVLVQRALWRGTGRAGRDLLCGQHPGGHLGAAGGAHRQAVLA